MTTKELQNRSERSQDLRVLKSNGNYFVESAEGMVLYKVNSAGEADKYVCTCGDYARGTKNDSNSQCKHILAVVSCVMTEQAEFLEKKKPKLDERFIKTIEGRDFVLYSGLLDLAHQKGLLKIEVEPLQYPTKENGYFAICKATAASKFGEIFIDAFLTGLKCTPVPEFTWPIPGQWKPSFCPSVWNTKKCSVKFSAGSKKRTQTDEVRKECGWGGGGSSGRRELVQSRFGKHSIRERVIRQ